MKFVYLSYTYKTLWYTAQRVSVVYEARANDLCVTALSELSRASKKQLKTWHAKLINPITKNYQQKMPDWRDKCSESF